jgi:hypothetical protein
MEGETEEAREERIREMAERKGYKLEKRGEGSGITPSTTALSALTRVPSSSIVIKGSISSRRLMGDSD